MQRAVARAIFSSRPDPLAEQDLAEHFEEFLTGQDDAPDSVVLSLSL